MSCGAGAAVQTQVKGCRELTGLLFFFLFPLKSYPHQPQRRTENNSSVNMAGNKNYPHLSTHLYFTVVSRHRQMTCNKYKIIVLSAKNM